MDGESKKELVDFTTQGGETFVKRFFNVLVSARHEAHYFYAADSLLVYNGTPYSGSAEIQSLYAGLPFRALEYTCVDAHPVPGVNPGSDGGQVLANILVQVSGTVEYDDGTDRAFSQTLMLAQDPRQPTTVFYIASDCYRETSTEGSIL